MDEMSGIAHTFRNLPSREFRHLRRDMQSEQFDAGMPDLVLCGSSPKIQQISVDSRILYTGPYPVPNPSSHPTLISAEMINPEDASRISRRDFGRHAARNRDAKFETRLQIGRAHV